VAGVRGKKPRGASCQPAAVGLGHAGGGVIVDAFRSRVITVHPGERPLPEGEIQSVSPAAAYRAGYATRCGPLARGDIEAGVEYNGNPSEYHH